MTLTFIRAYPPAQPAPGPAYWLPFCNNQVLVQNTSSGYALIEGADEIQSQLPSASLLYLGTLNGKTCIACEVAPEFALPPNWQEATQRQLFGRIDELLLGLIGYAMQIVAWQQNSRYCPRTGDLTGPMPGTWGRICPRCGYSSYPPVTPAILVLIHDGERMLLTHKPGWGRRYSCIAGFVEPGESLEGCVEREIYEEVGLEVSAIEYIGSQPWPFPHQLMVGYTARYQHGEVCVDQVELDDALWFTADTLPELPPPQSLARHIITTWIESRR